MEQPASPTAGRAGRLAFAALILANIDRARRTLKPLPVLALATIAGAGPLLLFALALGEQVMPGEWIPLILLSLGSQVLGQGLLVYSMGHLRPLVVGPDFSPSRR